MKAFSELTSASQVNNGDLLAISQTSGSGYASKKTTVKDIADFSNLNLAEEYDSTSTYAVDDYVIYESVLYKCIGTTTGTFDSTKWTSVVVTDEMGSGGGGGAGGHTIIDENGTSMTARSGLQFVGGANVSDDSTNNKTIVDIASAGGIDGVFIDADDVIKSQTTIEVDNEVSYTATEDCIVSYQLSAASDAAGYVKVDGEIIIAFYNQTSTRNIVYIKKGQTIAFRTKQSAGSYTVYGIQTGTTHSKFQPVIYSFEEREIGVWTDGKPLYEKTIDLGALPNNTTKAVNHNISNIDKIVFLNGIAVRATDNDTMPIPYVHRSNLSNQIQMWANDTSVSVGSASDASNRNGYAVIRYTKTTDTAGSGSWTPQGVPTHHYSTDEQIIGTWIDGSTLYEKTWDLGSDLLVSTSSWTTLGITLDADKIVETKTTASSGSFQGNILIYNDNGTWKGQTPRNGNDSSYVRYLTIAYTKSS